MCFLEEIQPRDTVCSKIKASRSQLKRRQPDPTNADGRSLIARGQGVLKFSDSLMGLYGSNSAPPPVPVSVL